MKFSNYIKSNFTLSLLLVIIIVITLLYFMWNKNEGIPTDSNLITTTNPYIIPPEIVLGKANTLVMQYKDQIKAQMNMINSMFDSNGILIPTAVTRIKTGLGQAAMQSNPALTPEQIDGVITPELIKQNIRKDYIKVFLDNVMDLATLVKQELN